MFGKFLKKSEKNNFDLGRVDLIEENQIEEILNLSKQKPVLLFKHSTRCGVSNMVLKRFEKKLKKEEKEFYYFYLDLLQNRGLSNYVSEKFDIPHQSPQLIVIKEGKVSSHNSHFGIMDIEF
ncbi:MAG: bacillithiol system redox-active protein YtxJ [Flavobacteriaceae bacterium]|nr:bacillithiol system redox-active protein YtxJ [Flavobacteriaceae bacterium]